MLINRILGIIVDSIILFLIYKIMDNLKVKDYLKYICLIILAIIMMPYFTIDYNWVTLLLALIIVYFEIKEKRTWKINLLIGVLAGVSITVKQTTGLVILFATIVVQLLQINSIDSLKKYLKEIVIRLIGALTVILVFLGILLKLKIFNEYIDYCILGVSTFSNTRSYFNGLIKNSNVLIRVLSIAPIIIYLNLIYNYIKQKNKNSLVLLVYSITLMILVYPISDENHFVVAIPITIISIGYLLNLLAEKMDIPDVETKFANLFLQNIIICGAIMWFLCSIYIIKSQNINTELKHFRYLPMEKNLISEIIQIEDFINEDENNVYILDPTASIYMIPIDKYNKNYDMFLIGNLGAKGEDAQIEELKKMINKKILILNSKYKRNWQNPEQVRKYIINEMTKTGEIGKFDIYE